MTAAQTTPQPDVNPLPKTANSNLNAIGFILGSVVSGAIGQLVLKAGMKELGPLQLSAETLMRMATNPLVIVGIAIFAVSTILWLLALMKADLSFAFPFLSLTYIVVLFGGTVLFHEEVTLARVIGFAVIVIGVWIVARSDKKDT
jgi:multidrug transporter EmrE-like cation transporter